MHASKALAALGLLATGLFGQTPPNPTFDVASIKPSPSLTALAAQIQAGKMHVGMSVDGSRVDIGFLSLADLIPMAFKVKPYQVSGPDWMKQERFDILATIPEGVSKDQVPEMLKALLIERFKLSVHRDTKEEPVYALVVGKNGPKMKASEPEESKTDTADAPPAPVPPPGPGRGQTSISTPNGQLNVSANGRGAVITGGPNGTMRMSMGDNGAMRMEMAKITMPALADMLGPFVDRPVVDMTDLKGNYQVALEMPMEDLLKIARARMPEMAGLPGPGLSGAGAAPGGAASAPVASDPTGTSIFQAVQQMGLKLEPRKAPIETIVVDHLEKTPTEN